MRDILRQILGIISALTAPLTSNLPELTGTGRSIAEQSDINDTLLVPAGIAFAIWGPIFLGLLAWAIIQGLPRNRNREVFRRTGWWVAGSLLLVSLWSVAASYAPVGISGWLTALIFVPATVFACVATWRFAAARPHLSGVERLLASAPVALFAGWCSLAVWLNWAQLGVHGPLGFGLPEVVVCLLALAGALAWISFNLHRSQGYWVYAFSPIWGLAFLAHARLAVDDLSPTIGIAAVVGALIVAGASVAAARMRPPLRNLQHISRS